MPLSPQSIRCLEKAGWRKTRRPRDISTYQKALSHAGYTLFDAAARFLEKFGGLRVTIPHHSDPNAQDDFHLDILVAIEGIYPEVIAGASAIIGEPVIPIGEVYRGHMTLLMDHSGRMYAVQGDLIFLLGQTGEDAINLLCAGKKPTTQITQPSAESRKERLGRPVPPELASRLRLYCHVEDPGGLDSLREIVRSPDPPVWVSIFREQLRDAIRSASISPKQIEDLTGEEFATVSEVTDYLKRIWTKMEWD